MSIERALEIMTDEVGNAIDGECLEGLRVIVASGLPASPLPHVPPSLSGRQP